MNRAPQDQRSPVMTRSLALTCALALLWAAGCGYSTGYSSTNAPGDTVAVDVVGNSSFRQKLEVPLTQALIEAVPTYSNMQLAGHDDARWILRANIEEIHGRTLVGPGGGNPVREGSLDYAVKAQLVDNRSGEVVREEMVLDRANFRTPIGETEGTAVREASLNLARKIVLALEEGF